MGRVKKNNQTCGQADYAPLTASARRDEARDGRGPSGQRLDGRASERPHGARIWPASFQRGTGPFSFGNSSEHGGDADFLGTSRADFTICKARGWQGDAGGVDQGRALSAAIRPPGDAPSGAATPQLAFGGGHLAVTYVAGSLLDRYRETVFRKRSRRIMANRSRKHNSGRFNSAPLRNSNCGSLLMHDHRQPSGIQLEKYGRLSGKRSRPVTPRNQRGR